MTHANNEKSSSCCILRGISKIIRVIFIAVTGIIAVIALWSFFNLLYKNDTTTKKTTLDKTSVLVINPKTDLSERGSGQAEKILGFVTSQHQQPTLLQTIKAIELAAYDSKISGIYINLSDHRIDLVQAEELGRALAKFTINSKNKPIVVYSDFYNMVSYYVASFANHILIDKYGSFDVRPFYLESRWIRGWYDKIGLEVLSARVGDYKNALAPTLFTEQTPEKTQEDRIYYSSVQNYLLQHIEQNKDTTLDNLIFTDQAKLQAVAIDGNSITSAQAKFLVDGTVLNDQHDFLNNYFKEAVDKKSNSISRISISNYLNNQKHQFFSIESDQNSNDYIGLFVLSGGVVYKGDPTQEIELNDAQRILNIAKLKHPPKVLLVSIDSPGGSVITAEGISDALTYLRSKGIIVVVSQASLAASAGYMFSAPANYIVSNNITLTGSIGVYLEKYGTPKLLKQYLGFNSDYQGDTILQNKRIIVPVLNKIATYTPTSGIQAYNQSTVNNTYRDFITRVAKDRGLKIDYVDSIARGRIWTGEAGLRIGLVDYLGGINKAYEVAQNLAQGLAVDHIRINHPQQFIGDEHTLYKLAQSIRNENDDGSLDNVAYAAEDAKIDKDLPIVYFNPIKDQDSYWQLALSKIENQGKILAVMYSEKLNYSEAKQLVNSFSVGNTKEILQAKLIFNNQLTKE